MDAKHLAVVFSPVLNGEVVQVAIEELDTAVPRCREDLIFVDFRPGKVIEGVLGSETVAS